MDFYMYHGRLDPDGGPSDEDGNCIDNWGFEGPRLAGVTGFHCTYGVDGHWNLWFDKPTSADIAEALTGWDRWEDCALTVAFSTDNSLVSIFNTAKQRAEYFGDWGIK